jgi:hypothetical protein
MFFEQSAWRPVSPVYDRTTRSSSLLRTSENTKAERLGERSRRITEDRRGGSAADSGTNTDGTCADASTSQFGWRRECGMTLSSCKNFYTAIGFIKIWRCFGMALVGAINLYLAYRYPWLGQTWNGLRD